VLILIHCTFNNKAKLNHADFLCCLTFLNYAFFTPQQPLVADIAKTFTFMMQLDFDVLACSEELLNLVSANTTFNSC
jgi:hypothetical protein